MIQDAAQGYYWANPKATFHPCVADYKEKSKIESVSSVMVSDCLNHDTVMVSPFLIKLISLIKTTQYKKRNNFVYLAYHTDKIILYLQSGICLLHRMVKDHVMGLVAPSKDMPPELVCSDQLTFKSRLLQLYEWAKENLAEITTIFCSADDIKDMEEK